MYGLMVLSWLGLPLGLCSRGDFLKTGRPSSVTIQTISVTTFQFESQTLQGPWAQHVLEGFVDMKNTYLEISEASWQCFRDLQMSPSRLLQYRVHSQQNGDFVGVQQSYWEVVKGKQVFKRHLNVLVWKMTQNCMDCEGVLNLPTWKCIKSVK